MKLDYSQDKERIVNILKSFRFKHIKESYDKYYWFTISQEWPVSEDSIELYVMFEDDYDHITINLSNFQWKYEGGDILEQIYDSCFHFPNSCIYDKESKSIFTEKIREQYEFGVQSFKEKYEQSQLK